jgi:uncharacterized protein
MKIKIDQIPEGGLRLAETIPAEKMDLDTDVAKFRNPVEARAEVFKVNDAVTVHLDLNTSMHLACSRCFDDFEIPLKKSLDLSYPVDNPHGTIDLDQDIRQDIILGYPIKPLCLPDCKGLCIKCGENLNKGKCNCK